MEKLRTDELLKEVTSSEIASYSKDTQTRPTVDSKGEREVVLPHEAGDKEVGQSPSLLDMFNSMEKRLNQQKERRLKEADSSDLTGDKESKAKVKAKQNLPVIREERSSTTESPNTPQTKALEKLYPSFK